MKLAQKFAISYSQKASWSRYKTNPIGLADKTSLALKIKGSLDLIILENALHILVERHPILNTGYCEREGEVIEISPEVLIADLEEIDASTQSDRDFDKTILYHF